jgi:hypothetical protein
MKNPFALATPAITYPPSERQISYLRDLKFKRSVIEGKPLDQDELDAWVARSDSSTVSAEIDSTKQWISENKTRTAISVEDGFWELPDGRIVKVQIAVHGSGMPYAKLLDTDTGKFVFDDRVIHEVARTGTRLSLDRAKNLGRLYGRCIICGIVLTKEESIEAGIGPICAGKL